MIDITIKMKDRNYNFNKSEIKFQIDPNEDTISLYIGGKDTEWIINKKDFDVVSKIIGGFDE